MSKKPRTAKSRVRKPAEELRVKKFLVCMTQEEHDFAVFLAKRRGYGSDARPNLSTAIREVYLDTAEEADYEDFLGGESS